MHLLKEMTILYVEDDADVLQALAASLQRWSKKLLTAADGREGWELYRRHQEEIDLVLTDIKMPVMDGIALIKAIRKEDEEIPVLITSAHGESHYLYEAIEEGVNGYLLKPLSIKRLKRVLQSVSKSLCYDTLRHDYLNLLRKGVEKTDTPTLLVEDAQPLAASPEALRLAGVSEVAELDKKEIETCVKQGCKELFGYFVAYEKLNAGAVLLHIKE